VIFMPINVLAGIGGMSEFSMMTQGIPWPLAYTGFVFAMVIVGALTFYGLRYFVLRLALLRGKPGTYAACRRPAS